MISKILSVLLDNLTIANILPTAVMLLIVIPLSVWEFDCLRERRKDRALERKRKEIELNHLEAELKQKERDISNQHALKDAETLLSIAPKAVKNSVSTEDLADLFRTARGDQTKPQHDQTLPNSDSEEPRKLFQFPKN